MADLMGSLLEGADSSIHKSPEDVIGTPPSFLEIQHVFMDLLNLGVGVLWVEIPIELCSGRAELEVREVDEVDSIGVPHIEKGSIPLLAAQAFDPWEVGAQPG